MARNQPGQNICAIRAAARLYPYQFIPGGGIFTGNAKVELRGERHLFGSFTRAFKNESRRITAFLHPNGAEPQIPEWFTVFLPKALAKKEGVSCAVQPRLRFLNGYEVLRRGGKTARFVLPGIGAMPVLKPYPPCGTGTYPHRFYRCGTS
jgi:hypothetical protein